MLTAGATLLAGQLGRPATTAEPMAAATGDPALTAAIDTTSRTTPARRPRRSRSGVTALSGYVSNADGRELVSAMISNDYLSSPRGLEDALGVTLASWSESDSADEAEAPRVNTRELRQRTDYGPEGLECSWVKAC